MPTQTQSTSPKSDYKLQGQFEKAPEHAYKGVVVRKSQKKHTNSIMEYF